MAHDETDFDQLLKEAREWDARDRQRHKAMMQDDAVAQAFPTAASPPPTVSIGELQKKATADLGTARRPDVKMHAVQAAKAFRDVLQTAAKRPREPAKAERAKRKGGWGWIIYLIAAYFFFKHFLR
jgi:hypothetical protein